MLRRRSSKDFDDSAGSALLDAINRSKGRLVRFILDASKDEVDSVVNYCDFGGKTPLIRAVYIQEEKCRQYTLQLLLSRQADPNIQDDSGRTALSYACEFFLKDVIKLLIRWNADPNIGDKNGITPLMYCAKVGNDAGISILLKCFRRLGLNVDQKSNDGFTALHLAAMNKHIESASKLTIDGHASVTEADVQHGRTAEQWARLKGCRTPEVVLFSTSSQKLQRPRHASRNHYKSLQSLPSASESKLNTQAQGRKMGSFSKQSALFRNKTDTKIECYDGSPGDIDPSLSKSSFGVNSVGSLSDKDSHRLEDDFLSKSTSNLNMLKTSVSKLKGKSHDKDNVKSDRHSQYIGRSMESF